MSLSPLSGHLDLVTIPKLLVLLIDPLGSYTNTIIKKSRPLGQIIGPTSHILPPERERK